MKTVEFYSRHAFITMVHCGFIDCRDTACISISCTPEERHEVEGLLFKNQGNIKSDYIGDDVLTVDFFDDESSFTDDHAKRITNFIDRNRNKNFVVHCFVGVSRSGAVAKFINEYLERDIPHINDYNLYNTYVFNKLNAAVGLDLASYYAELEIQDRPNFSG